MQQLLRRSDLSESELQLVRLIENLGVGRIERLPFRAGRPVLEPLPRIVAMVKMAGERGTPDLEARTGSCLKQSLFELFALMRRAVEGELLVVEVRHGLPFSVEIEWLGTH
jgi:hypothetical protein